jgi:hypothetical protein
MITEAIGTILTGDATLSATCDIYNTTIPQEAANPALFYSIESQDPTYTKDGAAPVVYTYLEVNIYANGTPKTGWTIEGYVKDALDQYSGVANGVDIDLIQWEGSDDGAYDPDRDEYEVQMGFRIRTK